MNAVRALKSAAPAVWLSPQQVCQHVPGLTVANLKAMRANGTGPAFSKPTGQYGRVTLYSLADVDAWVAAARVSTKEQS